jgi:Ca2+/Na+ antiporter
MSGLAALLTVVAAAMVGMALTFFAVCVVCDDFLVPAIDVFIDQFKIPEDVAGVTLVAFGSAAPELFLNLLSAANGTSDLSLSALLGSSIVAFGLIPPLCILMTSEKELELKTWPVVREIIFYLMGLIVFLVVIQDGEMTMIEAGASLAIYVIYVIGVIVVYWWWPEATESVNSAHNSMADLEGAGKVITVGSDNASKSPMAVANSSGGVAKSRDKTASAAIREESNLLVDGSAPSSSSSSSASSSSGVKIDGIDEDVESVVHVPRGGNHTFQLWLRNSGQALFGRVAARSKLIWATATTPVHFAIHKMLPSLHMPAGHGEGDKVKVSFIRATSVLVSCIMSISVLAYCIIVLSETLITRIGVGTSTVGATLVALGSEIPDAISSVALARSGYNDGAMAGAIGSQVINISLGVGLPTLLACFLTGESIKIDLQETRSLWLLTILLFIILIGYIMMTLPSLRSLSCTITKHTHIRRPGANGLLMLLAAVTLAFVWLNEEMIDEMEVEEAAQDAKEQAARAAVKATRRLFF